MAIEHKTPTTNHNASTLIGTDTAAERNINHVIRRDFDNIDPTSRKTLL